MLMKLTPRHKEIKLLQDLQLVSRIWTSLTCMIGNFPSIPIALENALVVQYDKKMISLFYLCLWKDLMIAITMECLILHNYIIEH
jgi:hypothetical protein